MKSLISPLFTLAASMAMSHHNLPHSDSPSLAALLRGRKQRHGEFSFRLNSLRPDILRQLNYEILHTGAIKRTDRFRRRERLNRRTKSQWKRAKGKREFMDAKSHRSGSEWMI
jgi:hypothetical protein